jgi:peptidoglycan-associated lipoprotein
LQNVWYFLSKKSKLVKILEKGTEIPLEEKKMSRKCSCYVGILLLGVLLSLSACSSKNDDAKVLAPVQDPDAIGQEESLESQSIGIMEGRTTGPMLPVYFGFDNYSIRADQRPRMKVNADFLKEQSSVTIRIEGNCDPRGTREYNLALGEKRALSAKKYLVTMGVDADRISTVSLGEEKILLHGQDEMAWAQNRRDDFIAE